MPADIADPLLHVLRIRGRATPESLAAALDSTPERVGAALLILESTGLAENTGKPRLGWKITPDGTASAEKRMTQISPSAQATVADRYETFRTLNDELKQLCANWQSRAETQGPADFVAPLSVVDKEVQQLLAEITPGAPHFAEYSARFTRALDQFASGSDSHLTGVLVDSYHNIWFECHECFYITLGRSRHAEEAP
ncbi:hypothetical protein BLA60_29480 [Actinophytocola xinjiangensis]|uniref:MarR family protein n=1 Tax=Actinophytocola xinjiangensis TaxID=485602 RepID=A0A7Z1AV89_9PSEU|nr:hypothetical protein [Actinophytocola xinjiangensis]OLF06989.1 hypothetical protein BLA60_29480 [Actinophytocola xinjiangensis]